MPFSKDASLLPITVQEADVAIRATGLDEIGRRIGRRFVRQEPRQRALAYLKGLLYPIERKNSWQIAEALGDPVPYGVQHLLDRARWDADLVRELTRNFLSYLGISAPTGVSSRNQPGSRS